MFDVTEPSPLKRSVNRAWLMTICSIHSGHFYSAASSPLLLRGAPDYSTDTVHIGVSRRSAKATADKGLAQGPYMAARAGVEPTALRLRVIASTNAPQINPFWCDPSTLLISSTN